MRFVQDAADTKTTHITFDFQNAGTYAAKITAGGCPAGSTALWNASSIADGKDAPRVGIADDGWLNSVADGSHALEISDGSTSACTVLPNIVNGPYANKMVDAAALAPYGVGLRDVVNDTNTSVVAYVPLSPVSDDTGGGRTAFSARMLYWTGGDSSWIEAQKLHVTWALQSLTDSCEMGDFPPTLEEYQETHPDATQEEYDEALNEHCLEPENRSTDDLQVVQTYDEPFHITGLAVTEQHGLDVAVIYPNPEKPYDEDPLWQLSWGLGQSFIPGRDCENDASIHTTSETDTCDNPDGQRDLTVFRTVYANDSPGRQIGNSTLYDRWGTDGAGWTGSPALWDIAPYSLDVENYRYPTTRLPVVCSDEGHANGAREVPDQREPSLLFAREERIRGGGLEAGSTVRGHVDAGRGQRHLSGADARFDELVPVPLQPRGARRQGDRVGGVPDRRVLRNAGREAAGLLHRVLRGERRGS